MEVWKLFEDAVPVSVLFGQMDRRLTSKPLNPQKYIRVDAHKEKKSNIISSKLTKLDSLGNNSPTHISPRTDQMPIADSNAIFALNKLRDASREDQDWVLSSFWLPSITLNLPVINFVLPSVVDLARAVEKTAQEISHALNVRKDGGKIPDLWAAILEALALCLTVEPGQDMPAT